MNTVEQAIHDIREGKFVIVVDDEDRENEGDFIIAAERISPEKVNFMLRYGRGVLCVPLPEKRCAELGLLHQVTMNTSLLGTPFTVTVDKKEGCTTGVSAHDRALTIAALADPKSTALTFAMPGHINPLYAKSRGVLQRAGHTEAAVDLMKLAGLQPVAALIEIMNEDGTMARKDTLDKLARQFNLSMISVQSLITYRLNNKNSDEPDDDIYLEKGETVFLPTKYGHFNLTPYRDMNTMLEHIVLTKGNWNTNEPVLCRVHSSCITGDIFGSLRCECGEQLHQAMAVIEREGTGLILYMSQEGRGIGLMNKIKAYKLQENGDDTVDANVHLGFRPDERDYGVGAHILRSLGITKLRLLTNNPTKRVGLQAYGIEIVENVPIEVKPNNYNMQYMKTKKERMNHNLNLV